MKYTALVIDYDPRSNEDMKALLEARGFDVVIVGDGEQGEATFNELRPELTFVEVVIPKKPGLEVCLTLKLAGATQPIVAMTSRFAARRYSGLATRDYKADDFVEKPVSNDALDSVLRKLMPNVPLAIPSEVQIPMPGSAPVAAAAVLDLSINPALVPDKSPPQPGVNAAPSAPASAANPPAASKAPVPSPIADAAESEIDERLDALLSDSMFGDD